VEGSTEKQSPDMMLKIQTLLLLVVVGEDVLSFSIGMIAPSIFVLVVVD
jgi:hypothetical protein